MICKVANACFCLVKAANQSVKESAGTASVRERDNNTSLGPSEAKVSARTDGAPGQGATWQRIGRLLYSIHVFTCSSEEA